MSYRSTKQQSLFASEFLMSDRKRQRLEQTWARDFRERCLPLIREALFRPLYHAENGAPCKSIRLVVAVLILQGLFDLTDEETQAAVDFDLRWHLALGLDPCDDGDYVSQRTLQYFRVRLLEHDGGEQLFFEVTDQLLVTLGLATGSQRLDTTHIRSNFAQLSRLQLFCETERLFLRALRRDAPALLDMVPASLCRRYLRDDGADTAYDKTRASDSRRRVSVAARDAYRLHEAFRGVALPEAVAEAYTRLTRLVSEHCVVGDTPQVAEAGDGDADLPAVPVEAKAPKTITPDSLQTPHDPDVTYSGHKGQGYEMLLTETCAPTNPVQLITHASLERSCESDADRVLPVLEGLEARGIALDALLADTAFGSTANYQACAAHGVELIAPTPGASAASSAAEPAAAEAGFTVQVFPQDSPSRCPAGVEAEATIVRETATGLVAMLQMPVGACTACPQQAGCPLVPRADGHSLVVLELSELLKADRRAFEGTPEFLNAYRPRAGIEGTNSEVKRGQGVGRLRVRGKDRVALALWFRLTACNVKRALRYWRDARKKTNTSTLFPPLRSLFAKYAPYFTWRRCFLVSLTCYATR